jgi:hypothetical protein
MRIYRAKLGALFAYVIVMSTLVVGGQATPARAHGTCELLYPQAACCQHQSLITSFRSDDNRFVKGQTKFFCVGSETHKSIYVQIKLFRCVAHQPFRCDAGQQFTQVGVDQTTCQPDKPVCQKTITVDCIAHRFYLAYGRFAAYNSAGTRVHNNPGWSSLDEEPYPQGGSPAGVMC